MCRFHTGFIIYLNTVFISWYSKKCSTIETCTFGIEFVAMKTDIESLCDIPVKVHLADIPIDGLISATSNAYKPELRLHTKNNAVYCMRVCSSGRVHNDNLSDLLTKVLCIGKRMYLVNNILYDKYDSELILCGCLVSKYSHVQVLVPEILDGTRTNMLEWKGYQGWMTDSDNRQGTGWLTIGNMG